MTRHFQPSVPGFVNDSHQWLENGTSVTWCHQTLRHKNTIKLWERSIVPGRGIKTEFVCFYDIMTRLWISLLSIKMELSGLELGESTITTIKHNYHMLFLVALSLSIFPIESLSIVQWRSMLFLRARMHRCYSSLLLRLIKMC